VHVTAEKFAVFVEKENDSTPFGVVQHHIEFALPFFHWKFLVADHKNNWLALIFLVEKRRGELQVGARAIVGQRSLGGTSREISGVSGTKGDRDRHNPNEHQQTVRKSLHWNFLLLNFYSYFLQYERDISEILSLTRNPILNSPLTPGGGQL
jgi:hypothetical protein